MLLSHQGYPVWTEVLFFFTDRHFENFQKTVSVYVPYTIRSTRKAQRPNLVKPFSSFRGRPQILLLISNEFKRSK